MSMNPGATTSPSASKISAPARSRWSPIAAIRPSSTRTSAGPSCPAAGSMTRPFLMRSEAIHAFSHDTLQHGHANRNAILHLVEDHRALKIGDLRGKLATAIDRARMHDDGVGLGQGQMLQAQSEKLEIFPGGNRRVMLALQLDTQHHDDVGVPDSISNIAREADAGR